MLSPNYNKTKDTVSILNIVQLEILMAMKIPIMVFWVMW